MGDLMRQVLDSSRPGGRVAGAERSTPTPWRLLGETSSLSASPLAKSGLIANSCPHRGASLFYRQERGKGLRCVYTAEVRRDRRVVDMPSEPLESNLSTRSGPRRLPLRRARRSNVTYMGVRETPPPLRTFEANMAPQPASP